MLTRQFSQRLHRGRFCKTCNLKIAWMYCQQQGGSFSNSRRVIAQAGAICCSDLYQLATTLAHYLGYPESTANLDKLAARNDNLPPHRQRGECQQYCCCIIVCNQGCLSARQFTE